MPSSIGEKIKKLRREKKLTQSKLAGGEMTKSMLSQIENNLATPSMKNLKYIANRLGKPVSYFLEDNYREDSNLPLDEISKEIKEIDNLRNSLKMKEAAKRINTLISKYDFDKNSKIYGDILYKLGVSLRHMNDINKSEEKINLAIDIYKSNHLYVEAAKAHMELSFRYWKNFEFKKALKILDESYDIYKKSFKEDITFIIEFLYTKSLVISALGDMKEALNILKKAIDMSKESNIYYQADELYRIYANINLFSDKYDEFLYNIKKARQFAVFIENKKNLCFIEFAKGLYENTLNNPSKALKHFEKSIEYLDEETYIHNIHISWSYYLLGEYNKAYDIIKNVTYPDNVFHSLDFLLLWLGKVYEGLILNKLGKSKEAIEKIYEGVEKMEGHSTSKYLSFSYKALSEVYSSLNDYEKAFKYLQRADKITEELKGLPLKIKN